MIVYLKVNVFRKPRIAAIGSSQWQVSLISIFELFEERRCRLLKRLILRVGGKGLQLLTKKIARFFKVGFYWPVFIAG